MKRFSSLFVLAAAVALVAGLTSALAASNLTSRSVTVSVANTGLGRVLVDGKGHTLYLFEKDKRGKSACAGQCAASWPPLIASGKPLAGAGARLALLGSIRRGDGRLQVTYNRHPLYTFVFDRKKGQTSGEELDSFGGEWYAIGAAGSKVAKSAAAGDAGDPIPSGYGY